MKSQSRQMTQLDSLTASGIAGLVAAAVFVGAAILVDNRAGSVLSGLGGLAWFVAAGMLAFAARRSERQRRLWWLIGGLTAIVAFVVRPSDILLAVVGFGAAGAVVGMFARQQPLLWASLVPALYLPAHIGAALIKAGIRQLFDLQATVRTEPPPTAAVVPLVIVIAALVAASAVVLIRTALTSGSVARRFHDLTEPN